MLTLLAELQAARSTLSPFLCQKCLKLRKFSSRGSAPHPAGALPQTPLGLRPRPRDPHPVTLMHAHPKAPVGAQGQAYPVRVKRFLMQHSVEDRILQLQTKKSALVKGALGAHAGEEAKAMRVEDLRYLFGK